MKPLTTAEAMAFAVLQGDLWAARQLADLLMEQTESGVLVESMPVRTVRGRNVKVAIFLREGALQAEAEESMAGVQSWLGAKGRQIIQFPHFVERIEIYELK